MKKWIRNWLHRIKRSFGIISILAVSVNAQQPTTVKPSASAVFKVQCLNAAGSAVESCGGSASAGLTDTQLRATAVPVSGTFWQAVQAVSGNFYQATQPVSIAATINAAVTNATLAVTQSGAWSVAATLAAETTKVIGTVNIAAGQTIGVTGTFWQATQPVSGPLTDTQLRAIAVPVSGTFYQATQPVSLAAAPTTPVTGTFWQTTQPISAASLPLPTGAATETTLATLNTRIATGSPVIVTPSTATLKSASFSVTATGTIVSAVAGKRIRVYALSYISGGAASVNFRDGASTALEGAYAHLANSGRVENINPPAFLFATTAGNSLDMVYSGAGTVGGRVSYWEE